MVFDVPTSVTAAIFMGALIFMGIAVPIALIVPIATRLAVRVLTAVTSVRADHTGRQSKDTCDHHVANHTIEGIHDYLREVSEADEYCRADLLRSPACRSPASH
jgi:hypothetical protein